jgi:hypothetical protein
VPPALQFSKYARTLDSLPEAREELIVCLAFTALNMHESFESLPLLSVIEY